MALEYSKLNPDLAQAVLRIGFEAHVAQVTLTTFHNYDIASWFLSPARAGDEPCYACDMRCWQGDLWLVRHVSGQVFAD